MGKFTNIYRLSKKEQEELFIDFARALGSVHSSVEAANFIRDLLSEAESLMLARRLQIARLLHEGYTYEQIKKDMKVSQTTIAKVQRWFQVYGEGYRTILERTKVKPAKSFLADQWSKHKKKYPMHYWPQLLLEEIVKSANMRQRKKLIAVVGQLRDKTKLSKDILSILQI